MDDDFHPAPRSWPEKFRHAFQGLWWSLRTQSSFHVHLVFLVLVVVAAAALRVRRVDWCLLLLCITVVLATEMLNTALERLAKAVDRRENAHLAAALDLGSAAVLIAAIGAVIVGLLVLLTCLGVELGWWTAS